MKAELYWLHGPWPGRLAIMPRPRGGDWLEAEIRAWSRAGINAIVSLLAPDEIADLDLSEEERLCEANGIQFVSFPIPDRGVPSSKEAVANLGAKWIALLNDGNNIAIHCRQGIGRAALIVICLLVLSGIDPETAIELVSSARGIAVPETAQQRRWIVDFATQTTTSSIK